MKTRIFHSRIFAAAVVVAALLQRPIGASANTDPVTAEGTQSPSATIALKLSYGVPDVVKLARAKVGDGVIVAYIENSGTVYNLSTEEIVYLQQAGVSERVISTMLGQRTKYVEAKASTAQTPSAYSSPQPTIASPSPTYVEPAPVYGQPAPVYAAPASSGYVIPYPAASYAYYGYYRPSYCAPYFGSYYQPYHRSYFGAPAVSFNFGFGGGHHFGGGRGGHHFSGGHHFRSQSHSHHR